MIEYFHHHLDDESGDILDQLEDDLLVVLLCRYSYQSAGVPKSHGFYDSVLFNLDENRFKTFVGCTRKHFVVIYNKIKEHPVFTGKNSEKQLSIYFQLALVMYRIGSNGNAASLRKLAALLGVGDGGTIDRITARVFESIEIGISKLAIGRRTSLGSCDYTLKLRQILVGYPGSVHDAGIFNSSNLALSPAKYFSGEEWIAVDSVYRLTQHVITPFRRNNSSPISADKKKNFNQFFSSYRVRMSTD
ncbi:hypothetical protein Bhyg_15451 [Pseudolycoriella hygida]|uniref:DDE Tnp4 domain-containing protein n=1 Tax=Pseudolycoriella hygida TaxID=35572 RepID=A0A9Q0MS09_9DIPT|nr:hypothetical protein Bhyg_15451 [Pseudolycoriella hygida]